MPPRSPSLPLMALALATALVAMPGRVAAQGLGAAVPGLPPVAVEPPSHLPAAPLRPLLRDSLRGLRGLQLDTLLRTERARLDVDPRGAPVLRGEFLATGLDEAGRAAALSAGFDAIPAGAADGPPDAADLLGELDLDVWRLRDLRGRSAVRAMRALQRAVPAATFAYQHLYLPAAAGHADRMDRATPATVQGASAPGLRLGMIDGGVDATVPALSKVRMQRHGCGGDAMPQPHGTLVAARLAGGLDATLYAADLWCGDAVGQATLGLVQALGWMARERVPVVNISLVGPDNPVLAQAVGAMVARGHVLVGAVGNDGPAAPPLYPAAYPGVIGVSGVDARQRILPESGSGPHVDFSAPGVVAGEGQRGTSFAAPLVARLAAAQVDAPAPGMAERVERALAGRARDLGRPGRDPRYGVGLLDPEN